MYNTYFAPTDAIGRKRRGLSHLSLRGADLYPWLLAVIVFLTRVATRSQLYFADGPAHVRASLDRTFVIQPPGYWLFNRFAGYFSDPARAISIFNILCSTASVIAFYHCARLLLSSISLARWGAAIYGCVFYAWFSAEVHSSYASQLLFPLLMLYCFLRHEQSEQAHFLYSAGALFALGAGLRPSDGAFVLPVLAWHLIRSRHRRQALIAASISILTCLAWLVPTALAYGMFDSSRAARQINYVATIVTIRSPVKHGVNRFTLANDTRVVVALLFAFWPFIPLIPFSRSLRWDPRLQMLVLWIAPGLTFFLTSYFADAPYLNFETAPILLIGLITMENSKKWIVATAAIICITSNVGFFLCFKPVLTRNLALNTINCYAGRFTLFSIRHQAFPNLIEVMKDPALLMRSAARR